MNTRNSNNDRDQHPIVIPAAKARQSEITGRVFTVLVTSTVLAVVCLGAVLIYFMWHYHYLQL